MTARLLLTLCLSALSAVPARAITRTLMEGTQASNNAIFVSTKTGSVYVRTAGTMTVAGNTFSVGISSFVVSGGSATVAYLMTARAFSGDGSALTNLPASAGISAGSTITWSGTHTFLQPVTISTNLVVVGSATATNFFGNGSNLTGIPSTASIVGVYAPLAGATFTGAVGMTNVALTLTGTGGKIVSGSSITASAFFGDGSNLSNLPAPSGELNTYTSSKTFTSSVLSKASVTASGFFGDGSGLTNITATVAQSSKTYNLTGTTTETTTFKLCYATGTLTTGGSAPIQVYYSGAITVLNAAGSYCVINIMQDGAFISPASSTIGMGVAVNGSGNGFGNATMSRVFPAPSAGSHSWCLSLISPFGGGCTFTSNSVLGNEFGVVELR